MSRPKSSTAGVIDLVVSGYSAAKIRGMAKTQERHMSNINDAIKAQARAQEAQAKSQALMVMGLASATSEGMHALASQQELNKRSIKKLETAFTDLIAQSTAHSCTTTATPAYVLIREFLWQDVAATQTLQVNHPTS